MSRQANVYMHGTLAGLLSEEPEVYRFQYDRDYLTLETAEPVSLTLPLQKEPFDSQTMIPFFDGLIPEGWLLDIVQNTWKLDSRDRMGLIMACCKDCIGAVSLEPVESDDG